MTLVTTKNVRKIELDSTLPLRELISEYIRQHPDMVSKLSAEEREKVLNNFTYDLFDDDTGDGTEPYIGISLRLEEDA